MNAIVAWIRSIFSSKNEVELSCWHCDESVTDYAEYEAHLIAEHRVTGF